MLPKKEIVVEEDIIYSTLCKGEGTAIVDNKKQQHINYMDLLGFFD